MKPSILQSMKKISPGKNETKKKSLFFSLNLTTLIDAFCILVIFLLSNMNGRVQNLQQSKDLVLPTATQTEFLDQGLVVRLEKNQIFVNDQPTTKDDMLKKLIANKKSTPNSLIIQADRNSDYESIAVVMRAGGQAGYDKYIFAVLPGT